MDVDMEKRRDCKDEWRVVAYASWGSCSLHAREIVTRCARSCLLRVWRWKTYLGYHVMLGIHRASQDSKTLCGEISLIFLVRGRRSRSFGKSLGLMLKGDSHSLPWRASTVTCVDRDDKQWMYSIILLHEARYFCHVPKFFCSLNIILQTGEKDQFNTLEISHFLVYVWKREHSLACFK